jgi:hypothetical protein
LPGHPKPIIDCDLDLDPDSDTDSDSDTDTDQDEGASLIINAICEYHVFAPAMLVMAQLFEPTFYLMGVRIALLCASFSFGNLIA